MQLSGCWRLAQQTSHCPQDLLVNCPVADREAGSLSAVLCECGCCYGVLSLGYSLWSWGHKVSVQLFGVTRVQTSKLSVSAVFLLVMCLKFQIICRLPNHTIN